MLRLNEIFKKKKKKEMKYPIDAVITNLDVALRSDFSPDGHFCSFTFIDERPTFPRVKKTLEQLKVNPDVHVVNHRYTWHEITKDTDLSCLEITKH
tara:strand:+ start:748 stop:1035 length:288 start_codon:yes stop_codon:yes gene_type:complete